MQKSYHFNIINITVFLLFCLFIINLYMFLSVSQKIVKINNPSLYLFTLVILIILIAINLKSGKDARNLKIIKEDQHISDSAEDKDEQGNIRFRSKEEINLKLKLNELKSVNSILVKNLRSKDQLIKLVSHDLKAPLRNVIGLTDSIMRKYTSDLSTDLTDRLNRVKSNIEKELQLISNILNDFQSEGFQSKSIDLNTTIKLLISQFEHEIQAKKIKVEIVRSLPTIKINGEIIKHILQNLVDNAIKNFTGLKDNKIKIDCRVSQYEYIISIEDNGPGIPADIQENVFDFANPIKNNNSSTENSGLGLPLVKTFAQMLNGKICFTSNEVSGTTFYLSLPKVIIT